MIKNVTEGVAAWLAGSILVALVFAAFLSLPGCQNETTVLNLVHRVVNGYCVLSEEKREGVRDRFNAGSEHEVRITCAGGE